MNKLCLLFLFLLVSHSAFCWDGQVTGTLNKIQAHSPASSNRDITVEILGETDFCGLPTNNSSGYLKKSDHPEQFNTMLSVLFIAKTTKADVALYMNAGRDTERETER